METLDYIPETERSCVALGFFDGIHTAHAAVINAAFAGNGERIVLSVGAKAQAGGAILTKEETAYQLGLLGAQLHLTPDFAQIKDMSGEAFVDEILVGRLHAARVACGFNYRFGAGACCGADELAAMCAAGGIECVVVPPVMCAGETVSSTAIRRALSEGETALAGRLLGRRYGYTLQVVDGQHLGRRLGTPTINQEMPEGLLLPRFGVYASVTCANGRWHSSVTNIGVRPTVGAPAPISETWLHSFSGDLYGENIRVELVDFIRPETRFSSIDELRMQIVRDGETAVSITENLVNTMNSGENI